jgi:hypothetical protein
MSREDDGQPPGRGRPANDAAFPHLNVQPDRVLAPGIFHRGGLAAAKQRQQSSGARHHRNQRRWSPKFVHNAQHVVAACCRARGKSLASTARAIKQLTAAELARVSTRSYTPRAAQRLVALHSLN